MRAKITLTTFLMLAFPTSAFTDSVPVESRVVRVGMFKNGLAVVKRIVELPPGSNGPFEVLDVPEPVHGTFWIESNGEVATRVTSREVESPLDAAAGADFQSELAGKRVIVHFREPGVQSISGRVVELKTDSGRGWSRSYEPPNYQYWHWNQNNLGGAQPLAPGRYLVLENDAGQAYVDLSTMASLSVEDPANVVKRRRNVLIFTLKPGADRASAQPTTIAVTYLSKGMSWAPGYLVDISDKQNLTLRQQAVIKNELGDMEQAELFLISGFPSVEFGHVVSPLSPTTNLTQFFTQLSQRLGQSSHVATQQAIMSNFAAPAQGVDLNAAAEEGSSVDLHYEPAGRHTLLEGDSLLLSVASGRASYQRIVDWTIPDTRNEWGRPVDEYRMQQEPEKFQDALWDAIQFNNPLAFPLTTAPATIVADERFQGQRTIFWTNPGEQATLKITKALSVRATHSEYEEPGGREVIGWGGRTFRVVPVKGELVMKNHRAVPITLMARRRFSGELTEAEGAPKSQLLEQGVYSVNRRNELVWTVKLDPAEEKTLRYRYTVLVHH